MKNEKEVKETKKGKNTKGSTTKKEKTTQKKSTNKAVAKKKEPTKKIEVKAKVEEVVVEEKVVEEKIVNKNTLEKTTKKTFAKNDLFLVLALVVVVVLGCVFMWVDKPVPGYELSLTLSGEAGLHQLTYQEYQEKIDNDEEFVVILERATCSHCITYMPIAESFAKDNNVPMYYVDTDTFTEEDWLGFQTSNSYLKENANGWGTPTTLVLAGSEEVANIEGSTDAETLLNLYNEYFEMGEE